jgi:hypothetical protein
MGLTRLFCRNCRRGYLGAYVSYNETLCGPCRKRVGR